MNQLGIAPAMAAEIAFENDDDFGMQRNETGVDRWNRMRKWVADNLHLAPSVRGAPSSGGESEGGGRG